MLNVARRSDQDGTGVLADLRSEANQTSSKKLQNRNPGAHLRGKWI